VRAWRVSRQSVTRKAALLLKLAVLRPPRPLVEAVEGARHRHWVLLRGFYRIFIGSWVDRFPFIFSPASIKFFRARFQCRVRFILSSRNRMVRAMNRVASLTLVNLRSWPKTEVYLTTSKLFLTFARLNSLCCHNKKIG